MSRHTRYVKNKRTGDIGTIVKGDLLHVPFSGLLGGATGQDLHVESATKLYNLGTRRVTPDGRVFKYARASNIVSVRHFGLKFWGQIGDGYAGTAVLTASIGDKTFVATIAGTVKDEYAGGYVTFFTTPVQTRCIVSNTVANAADNTVIFTLDQPLTTALVTATTYTEILQSPYANVRLTAGPSGGDAGNDFSSVAGIPACITTVANYYLWIQTWGPIWVNPHGALLQNAGIAGGYRKLVFDVEGSICIEDEVAHGPGADTDEHQIAGFIIDRNAAGASGPPLIMLQISP